MPIDDLQCFYGVGQVPSVLVSAGSVKFKPAQEGHILVDPSSWQQQQLGQPTHLLKMLILVK